ncbi:MAG: Polysaccharide deacetylase [Spirochaetes bacterium ADurb.Bin001]|nr:MAG: Polysaccharide deacetylase [Spirochaetes bacterium ADurb.Bin001]
MDAGTLALAKSYTNTQIVSKMDAINANHFFADDTARDAYFASTPTEKVVGVLVSSNDVYQMWNGTAWVVKTPVSGVAKSDFNGVIAQLAENANEGIRRAEINNARKPLVTFTYDGTYAECLNILVPIFTSKGVKVTFGIQTGQIGGLGMLTAEGILALQDTHGHEIASHSVNHPSLPTSTIIDCEYELFESKKILEDMGCNVNHFFYPQGDYNETVINLTRKYYKTAALAANPPELGEAVGRYNNVPPINTYKLLRKAMAAPGGNPSLTTLKSHVDSAFENNAWLIFYAHGIDYKDNATEQQVLSDLIDYIQSLNIDIVTLNEGYSAFANKVDIGYFGRNKWSMADVWPYDYMGSHYMVGCDGTVKFSDVESIKDYTIAIPNAYSASDLITEYPINKITTFRVNTEN